MVTYESFYQGGTNPLSPSYSSIGYKIDLGNVGMTLDGRTANQLKDLNLKINTGAKVFEVQGTSAAIWESVPEQHIEEMRRLMQITGTSPTFHAPIVEASGVGEKGWNESSRLSAELQLESAIMRANRLDKNGNVAVTVHSTASLPDMQPMMIKPGEKKPAPTALWVIDPQSGKITAIQPEKRYFPEGGKFEPEKAGVFAPEKELDKLNKDLWARSLADVNRQANYGEEILDRAKKLYASSSNQAKGEEADLLFSEIAKTPSEALNELAEKAHEEMDVISNMKKEINHGEIYLRNAYQSLKDLFDKAYANAPENSQRQIELKNFANKVAGQVKEWDSEHVGKTSEFVDVINKGMELLQKETPQTFRPLNEFVIEQSATTYGNVAAKGYKKFKEKAPVIQIENPPAGMGLSTGEDIANIVKASRGKMQETLVKEGMDKEEAKRIAEKTIGATWDVGHINMLRKQGYSSEDIIKETKKVAPYVKHVHLSDNFGLEHTELPMGMGNVPIKEIMQKLGQEGFKGKSIVEAISWWQHFAAPGQGGANPFSTTIESFNSPIYAMKAGANWSQAGAFGEYSTGFGIINPPTHHSIYGGGFTALPLELGGTIQQGDRSTFSGAANY